MTVNENVFFRQATLRICGHLDIERAMYECLNYLSTIISADLMCMEIYEPDIDSLRIIAKATHSECKRVDLLIHMNHKAKSLMEKIYNKFKVSGWPDAVIINDPEKDPVARLIMKEFNELDASLLHMALETEDRPLCSIFVAAKGKNSYSEEDARLFSLLKEPFSVAMSNTLKHREVIQLKELLADDNRFLQRQLFCLSGEQIIGADFGLKKVMEMVRQVAAHDSPVLFLGETGVGKDVLANAIHYSSTRKKGPFIAVNCGAIPENLLDSELFGHEKGAFTGATTQKRGRFERADNGTIFLDEIGELPPQAQVRLLRVLQNKEIERVGGTRQIPLSIRVVAATNKNLEEMIESRQFREDLWFRLNVFPIYIPPLRERKEDIPALVRHFIAKKSIELKLPAVPKLAPGAIDRLSGYNWPGNVREMENVVERALIVNHRDPLTFENIGLYHKKRKAENRFENEDSPLKYDEVIFNYIQQILVITNGKIHGLEGAAELMGINPSTLRSKIKKLGINYKRKTNSDKI
jgi:transcriptional regulator with GAF, ATPase, and Fis domain